MSYDESLRSISLAADSTLAGYTGVPGLPGSADPNDGKALYRFVKVSGKNQVGLVTKRGERAIGVCQNKPQVAGQAATVAIRGVSNVIVGASIAIGDELTSDEKGRAIPATSLGAAKTIDTASSFTLATGVVTVAAAAHGLSVGMRIRIAGAADAGNNGDFVIKTATTNAFTIDNPLGVTAAAAGATATQVIPNGTVHAIALQASTAVGSQIPALLKV